MGSRVPVKGKRKGVVHKCSHCSRSFATTVGLKTHVLSAHRKMRAKPLTKQKLTLNVNNTRTAVERTSLSSAKKKVAMNPSKKNGMSSTKEPVKQVKTVETKLEFECSICKESFRTLIGLSNHKRIHVKKDVPNEPIKSVINAENSTQNTRTPNNACQNSQTHPGENKHKVFIYKCALCDQEFGVISKLTQHMGSLHTDTMISMYFPSWPEYSQWRGDMEKQTNCKFKYHSKVDMRTINPCSCIMPTDNPAIFIQCPAVIITLNVHKGIQVYFYKHHIGHEHNVYEPSKNIDMYLIGKVNSKHATNSERLLLYKDFEAVMREIVKTSRSIELKFLKDLYAKALEMKSVLLEAPDVESKEVATDIDAVEREGSAVKRKPDNNFDDEVRTSKRIKNRQAKNLDFKPAAQKYLSVKKDILISTKDNSIVVDQREECSPIIINTFTIDPVVSDMLPDCTEEIKEEILPEENVETNTSIESETNATLNTDKVVPYKYQYEKSQLVQEAIKSPKVKFEELVQLSSFNDSYKSFVEKKIGGKPAAKSDLKAQSVVSDNKNTKKTNNILITSNHDVNPPATTELRKKPISKKKTNERKPMKTKLGQFSPKKSPPSQQHTNKSSIKIDTIKFDEYEVKERENECNILILKI